MTTTRMTKEELKNKVLEYYNLLEKGNITDIINLYSAANFSTTVIDPVGTPPRIGLAAIRELYEFALKPPLKVRIVPTNMFFAPSINTASTQMSSIRKKLFLRFDSTFHNRCKPIFTFLKLWIKQLTSL